MSSQVEQIKERLGIADVIGTYLKLEKAGGNYKARCPFHNEKTPSFFITPSRGTYYCFGCGAKGDIFSFVQEFEGVDFMGALKVLAERAGVELKREDPHARSERERLFACLESATIFYQKNLYTKTENREAVDYLIARGLAKETIKEWRIGFAEDDWRRLLHYLVHERKFTVGEIEKSGLIIRKEGARGPVGPGASVDDYYDRFRSRVMFPLFDSSGRVIGFSGRIFERGSEGGKKNAAGSVAGNAAEVAADKDGKVEKNEKAQQAKYVNSPETQLFHKSEVLYGFHAAKSAIRERDFTILVEGQMDMIMSQQAGFKNTVAVSGTALTAQHLERLQRLSNRVVMAFDPDSAGVKAASRSAQIALGMGMEVKVAALPKGEDPALFILNHPENNFAKWQEVIDKAVHIVEFTLNQLLARKKEAEKNAGQIEAQAGHFNDRVLAKEIAAQVLPFIAQIPNAMEKSSFVSLIENRTNFKNEMIWEDLKKAEKARDSHSTAVAVNDDASAAGSAGKENLRTIRTRRNMIEEKILGIILWQEDVQKNPAKNPGKDSDKDSAKNPGKKPDNDSGKAVLDVLTVGQRLEKILDKRLSELFSQVQERKDELILEAEISFDQSERLQQEVEELFVNLEEDCLKEQFAKALSELSLAEKAKDKERSKDLLQKCKDISDRLSALPKTK